MKLFARAKIPKIILDKNEIDCKKRRMDVLDETLKKCAFDLNKNDSLFSKRKTQGKCLLLAQHTEYVHKTQHANIKLICMAKCTHYGRKGHLAQLCYSRLNLRNKNI